MISDELRNKKVKRLDRYGNEVFDDGSPLRDGERISFPMLVMDGVPPGLLAQATMPFEERPVYIPRTVPLTNAQIAERAAAVDAKDQKLADAWRNPPPIDQAQLRGDPAPVSGDVYDKRDHALRNRWRDAR